MAEQGDGISANLLKTYPTEAAVLAASRAFADAYGELVAEDPGVIRTDRRSRSKPLAKE